MGGPTPLLLPSAVFLAIATGLGALVATRTRGVAAGFALAAALIPGLTAWVVLGAGLFELWRVPVLGVAVMGQLGLIAGLGRIPIRGVAVRSIGFAAVACLMGGSACAYGTTRISAGTTGCTETVMPNHMPFRTDDDVSIVGNDIGERSPQQWGPFACVVDLTTAAGTTLRHPLDARPIQLSGTVSCPTLELWSCPRAHVLHVEHATFRTTDLSRTTGSLAGNLASFGAPPAYVGLALLATLSALGLLALAVRRLPARRAVAGGDAHPYRAMEVEPDDPEPSMDHASTVLAFAASIVVCGGCTPLVVALVIR